MPSNTELANTIKQLADELGEEMPNLDNVGNTDRVEIAKEMRQRLKSIGTEPEPTADEPVAVADEPQADESAPAAGDDGEPLSESTVVAKGKSITCKKGILGEGAEVKPEYLNGGRRDFDRLVELGVIVEL